MINLIKIMSTHWSLCPTVCPTASYANRIRHCGWGRTRYLFFPQCTTSFSLHAHNVLVRSVFIRTIDSFSQPSYPQYIASFSLHARKVIADCLVQLPCPQCTALLSEHSYPQCTASFNSHTKCTAIFSLHSHNTLSHIDFIPTVHYLNKPRYPQCTASFILRTHNALVPCVACRSYKMPTARTRACKNRQPSLRGYVRIVGGRFKNAKVNPFIPTSLTFCDH